MHSENLSTIIKNGRKLKGYSQKELGELTGISHQIISRYEKGQEVPTKEKLDIILQTLNIQHDNLETNIIEIDKLFEKFISDQFYREVDYNYYIDSITNHYESYSICPNYYKIMIIEMVNEIIIGNGDLVNHHIRAIENLGITDNRALQIFYEYQGYYLLMKKDTQNGLTLLEKAKTLYYDEKTIAMIHYHMCFAHNYECLKRYDFDIIRQALEVFQKYHSYRRVENTMMIYGNFYDTKRNYNKALESYESCLNLSQLANENKSTFANLYRTISHLQLKNRKYIESLIYLEGSIQFND